MPANSLSKIDVFHLVKQIPMLAVIRKYGLLEVKKCGSRWMACCPFHEDNFPSLVVYRDGWKCFGCGAHGDITDFVARILNVKPLQAAKMIARDFGLYAGSLTPPVRKRLARLERKRKAEQKFRQRVDEAHRRLSLLVRTTERVLALDRWEAYNQLDSLVHKLPYWEFLLECMVHPDPEMQKIALDSGEVRRFLGIVNLREC
ncbi:hypothetical protein IT084_16890 [Desulfallas sp. Bu1-1]|uniref:CHC2 zinc finger domain-containing protein n=1 Tax=Desulfallas sp. Bu1-1 TaxID=2787620 RepID=UPI00189DE18C|nr:CHC2 zinc finger domain-containing protein [Desulfallas sp. Bu1-1]MBF7084617.1 hypothetical protein [Desulfallas sp. Bu1-1]